MRRPLALLAACLLLSACQLTQQTRYVGKIANCAGGAESPATLVVVERQFSFAPTDGTLILSGDVADDGHFAASPPSPRRESSRRGPGDAPFQPQRVAGRISGESAVGTYQSARCTVPFRLERVPSRLLP